MLKSRKTPSSREPDFGRDCEPTFSVAYHNEGEALEAEMRLAEMMKNEGISSRKMPSLYDRIAPSKPMCKTDQTIISVLEASESPLTASNMASACGVSKSTIEKAIYRLLESDNITRVGGKQNKGWLYSLASK